MPRHPNRSLWFMLRIWDSLAYRSSRRLFDLNHQLSWSRALDMVCDVAGVTKAGLESRKAAMRRRQKTAPKNAGLSVPTGKNSRKQLVRVSRPHKSGFLIKKDKRAKENLRKLNETLTVLFRFAPDAIIIVDESGCIVRVNEQARAMFGYTAKELIGNRIEMLMPPRFRKRHVGHQQRFMIEPRLRQMGAGLELYAQRKDGTEFFP